MINILYREMYKPESDEAYTSNNTTLLDVDGTVEKLLTTDYVRNELL